MPRFDVKLAFTPQGIETRELSRYVDVGAEADAPGDTDAESDAGAPRETTAKGATWVSMWGVHPA